MNKTKAVLRALIGYAGSSENPSKMSLRFMAIITAVVSQFSPLISVVIAYFGGDTLSMEGLSQVMEPIVLTVACIMWLIGAIRAVLNTKTVAGILKGE
jgi:formate hydrogenlyase subunit 3/multisubunit Na+/H+ antiporter MnhD subunit